MARKVSLSTEDFSSRLGVKRQSDVSRIGYEERRQRWDDVRSTCAQTLLAQPDVLFVLKCRNRNTLLTEVSALHGLLCRVAELIQEIVDFVPTPVTADTSTPLELIEKKFRGEAISTDMIKKAVGQSLSAEAKASIRGKRVLEQPTEEQVGLLLIESQRRLAAIKSRVASVLQAEILSDALIQTAQRPVLQKLHQALLLPAGSQRVLEVSKSVGSLEFSSRRSVLRFKVSEDLGVPVPFTSTILGSSVQFSVPAGLLDIEVGDLLGVGEITAQVTAVSGRTVTTASALPQGRVSVLSSAFSQYVPFRDLLLRFFDLSAAPLERPAALHNRPAAASLVQQILALAAELAPITTDARAAAAQLGVDTQVGSNLLGSLRSLTFTFSEEVVLQTQEVLRTLRDEGFNKAAEQLLRGDYSTLIVSDPRDAADGLGQIDQSLGGFVRSLRSTL